MISDYSSYLEFIGAVYFTMSLDDILKRKVWGPQDENRLKKALDGFNVSKDQPLKDAIQKANRAKGEKLQSELSKKSVLGLFVIAGLLMICGYEQALEPTQLRIMHISILYTAIVFILMLFTCLIWFIFSKWKYTSATIFALFLAFSLIYFNNWVYGKSEIEMWLDDNVGWVISVLITIPILWQLFISWMYKSVFYGYIKNKIKEANDKYNAITANIARGNVSDIPDDYKKIFLQKTAQNMHGTAKDILDDSLTEYKGVLYADIKRIGENVYLHQLFYSWLAFHYRKFNGWIKSLFTARDEEKIKATNLNILDWQSHANRLTSLQASQNITVRQYCQTYGVDAGQFIKYLKKNKKK